MIAEIVGGALIGLLCLLWRNERKMRIEGRTSHLEIIKQLAIADRVVLIFYHRENPDQIQIEVKPVGELKQAAVMLEHALMGIKEELRAHKLATKH